MKKFEQNCMQILSIIHPSLSIKISILSIIRNNTYPGSDSEKVPENKAASTAIQTLTVRKADFLKKNRQASLPDLAK